MALFRKSRNKKPERHELLEIPIGSMIELSDSVTFEMSDAPTRTFELVERKKYEGDVMLRYMYILEDDGEQVVLGVDRVGGTDEYELSRWIIDDEEEVEDTEEADDVLGDNITLHYPDPEDDEAEIDVEYVRQESVQVTMTVVNDEEMNEYDAELYEYTNEDDGLMSVELCGTWLTFYVGQFIARTDVQIYPAEEEAEYI